MANNQMENVPSPSKDRAVKEVSRIYFATPFYFRLYRDTFQSYTYSITYRQREGNNYARKTREQTCWHIKDEIDVLRFKSRFY